MKLQKYFFWFLVLLFIIGVVHTSIVAYNIYNCIGCSAPWTVALFVPGVFYFFAILLGYIVYFFLKKKKTFAWGLIGGLTILILVILAKIFFQI